MKKNLFITLALILGSFYAHAQCATDQVTDNLYNTPEQKEKAFEKMAEELNVYRNNVANSNQTQAAGKRIIPVVFHIIHTYGPENISKAQILSQIDILNKDFSATNADIGGVRSVFQASIADMNVEFRLATKDPDGKCTEGITRTYSPLGKNTREETKSLIGWDNKKYLNIWVVESIRSDNNDGTTTLGFAYLPQSVLANPNLNGRDGIVIMASYVGNIGTSDANKAGRTLTHEVGHYLGLNHPFNNACGTTNCNSSGDFICDTPPVSSPSFGCSKTANSCTQDNPDLPDMTENFMDYANGNCQFMFTNGQKQVVDYIFGQSLRAALISGSNLSATGTADPYTNPTCTPIADFSNDTIIICAGSAVDFKNASYNGTPTNYTWTFNGGNPTVSNVENPTVLYINPGTYSVKLDVSNAQGNSSVTRNTKIIVRPATALAKAPQIEQFSNTNFPPANWEIPSSNELQWSRNNVSVDGNPGSAFVKIDNNSTDGLLASLDLLPVDLSTLGTEAYLNFKVAYKRRTNKSEILRVFASIDCGVNFVLLKQLVAGNLYGPNSDLYTGPNWQPANASEWLDFSLKISDPANKPNYIFRLQAVSYGGNNIYIDDINVSDKADQLTSNVKYPIAANLNVYPNPTNGDLNIEAAITEKTQISLVDMTGKVVLDLGVLAPNQNNYHFNTQSVSSGIYLVVLKNSKGVQYQKLVIQQ